MEFRMEPNLALGLIKHKGWSLSDCWVEEVEILKYIPVFD
jgi:hypothetical protein